MNFRISWCVLRTKALYQTYIAKSARTTPRSRRAFTRSIRKIPPTTNVLVSVFDVLVRCDSQHAGSTYKKMKREYRSLTIGPQGNRGEMTTGYTMMSPLGRT
jgi:hypothetical protein